MTVLQQPVMGIQTPRLALIPECYSNAAEEASDLCAAYGLILDDWQNLVLTAWLGENEEGNWASPSNGLSVPRQNGKGAVLLARELFGAVILGERILHTAHLLKTSKDHFERMLDLIDRNAELGKLVQKVVRTNGEEAIKFQNGGVIKFVARSKNSGRGFTADLLVCDEAQDMSDDDFAALQPTLYSVSNPQTILVGTPPVPTIDGTVWNRFKDLGGTNTEFFSWLEWSADKNDDFSDPYVWAKANPSLGFRGEVASVRNEYTTMDDETFARERLGMWAGIGSTSFFDMERWDSLKTNVDLTDPVVFAIDISPDLGRASIGVAGYLGNSVSVQCTDNRIGTEWIVDRLKQLQDKWNPVAIVIDQGGTAGALIPDLQRARIRITQVGTNEVVQATGEFYHAYKTDKLMHANQPVLNAAVAAATTRPVRSAFAWNRKNPNADITPLVAVTLAAHGLTSKRKPKGERTETQKRVRLL